jgi:hypothetical protein
MKNIPLVISDPISDPFLAIMKHHDLLNRLHRIETLEHRFGGAAVFTAHEYLHNDANQRVRSTLHDGSYWLYEYDKLGQVTLGKKYWNDGIPAAGQQFEYRYDDIGNRTHTKSGGDEDGIDMRESDYIADHLNRYVTRGVPGAVYVLGVANRNRKRVG